MNHQLSIFNKEAFTGIEMDFNAHIKNMSATERLKAMELLWDSLVTEKEEIPSPDWHKEILEGRAKNSQESLTIDEVKKRLK